MSGSEKKVRLTDDVMDQDFSHNEFTNQDVANAKGKVFTDVRMTMGLMYGKEEWEERRKKVLEKPMH